MYEWNTSTSKTSKPILSDCFFLFFFNVYFRQLVQIFLSFLNFWHLKSTVWKAALVSFRWCWIYLMLNRSFSVTLGRSVAVWYSPGFYSGSPVVYNLHACPSYISVPGFAMHVFLPNCSNALYSGINNRLTVFEIQNAAADSHSEERPHHTAPHCPLLVTCQG